MIRKHSKIAIFAATLAVALIGVGTVRAINLLKSDEVQLKQQMKPLVPIGERPVDLIGIYPPGFETDLVKAQANYEKEFGVENFQSISYKGYTLLVPPTKNAEALEEVKRDIDSQIASAQGNAPSTEVQAAQIGQIREVFGTAGNITYNSFMGAYTDEKGFQYNFYKDELMGKQVGVTNSLAEKFNSAYPHFKNGTVPAGAKALVQAQARMKTDVVIEKAFGPERAGSLKTKVEFLPLEGPRLGVTYGDNEVQMLVDTVTGDIIHYSRNK